jgi:hypothetical protein
VSVHQESPYSGLLLAGLIPQARIKIYPDSAHEFLFQHHTEFAADVVVTVALSAIFLHQPLGRARSAALPLTLLGATLLALSTG